MLKNQHPNFYPMKIRYALFPELFIFDVILKYGFIREKDIYSHLREKDTITNTTPEITTNKKLTKTTQIIDVYEQIVIDLQKKIIGQETAVKELVIAFKRPHIVGNITNKPKNVFVIIGDIGNGKEFLIHQCLKNFYQHKLVSSTTLVQMDLSLYPTQSETNLFMSDLYKNLHSTSSVLIFNNFKKCHASFLNIISQLVIEGEFQLSSRYSESNGFLVESTGTLTNNSISMLKCNNKYLIFVTELSEKNITETFGSQFMEYVNDYVYISDYTKDHIIQITYTFLNSLISRVHKQLSIKLSFDESFVIFLTSKYKKQLGFSIIEKFISHNVYKAISEYKLRNTLLPLTTCKLCHRDQRLLMQITKDSNVEEFNLNPYILKNKVTHLDDIKKELNSIIGLKEVKDYVLDLESNLKVQQMREDAGHKVASISKHMIFIGNPGTGKTTIARIVAKYLKGIGALSIGQLREVTRADLVGQYVGHTAKQTNEVIQSAIGGVLFIDEAYSLCRDKYDTFGLEAIDALVKAIEDHRDDLVVILAGYKEEMSGFLDTNSGLKSRFPNIINFEDYTALEMVRISEIIALSKGYIIDKNVHDSLEKVFIKSQIKGKNDSGNGRLVRNIIESAILVQSKRLLSSPKQEMDLLVYSDFEFESFEKFDLEKSFESIIGLETVKDFIKTQHNLLLANEKRRQAGIQLDTTQSLNMIFAGNPGTGKTTIARIVASAFKDMGLLKQGHLIEVDKSDLISEYVGQTAQKTEEVFRKALGGILFIDEAYALNNDQSKVGQEAIDTLVKLIEDYRGEIVIILAGYTKEMNDFLKANSGLKSRFPLNIEFPDYTAEELYQISLKIISSKGFHINKEAHTLLKDNIRKLHKTSDSHSGNGRMVRNFIEKIMRNQSIRIALNEKITKEELTNIIATDIDDNTKKIVLNPFDLETALSKIIGLQEIKEYIRRLHASLKIYNERKKIGLTSESTQTLHMIFTGNPGTGKTMIARTIADILFNIGIINTNKLVEIDRADLVAGYVGQTAIKTKEKIMEALDGVLFIDEAYSLARGGNNDFGREAIDTIVKLMDDYKDRLVVILAGYSENMQDFLKINPGLNSRFPNIIEFTDYSSVELVEIANLMYSSKNYTLSDRAITKMKSIFNTAVQQPAFGNGRYVRNIIERSINNQSYRLSTDIDLTREELITIEESDIEEA